MVKRWALVVGFCALALAGCSAADDPDGTTAPRPPASASAGDTRTSTPAGDTSPSAVAGTYANDAGDWVVRLNPDGTWEEDLGGKVNAYRGTFVLSGTELTLNADNGSSVKAELTGDQLKLPSVTLTKR
ncbi:hypothetical protein GOARA_030_00090 [Gordonia araii NBRC 100433]|uniref:Lipoprotein n=1 Tax=Gordonia araii NBRC 100433 TaxID=1073574 RepID=G7GZZ4_9ACTN|nr:hypothetical protein [Gordonia araii]NNG98348.1 hypothetical protein [Gordonia araii NBRC 100433]GAB09169.1 hypothetical protein GOARA_030_00090 [Gordonia araii NBRC 100433]